MRNIDDLFFPLELLPTLADKAAFDFSFSIDERENFRIGGVSG
jgi:hypothetical protein